MVWPSLHPERGAGTVGVGGQEPCLQECVFMGNCLRFNKRHVQGDWSRDWGREREEGRVLI